LSLLRVPEWRIGLRCGLTDFSYSPTD